MASNVDQDLGVTDPAAPPRGQAGPADQDPGATVRDDLAKLRRPAPDDEPAGPPAIRTVPGVTERRTEALVARARLRMPSEPWPDGVKLAAQIAALAALFAAFLYGPSVYECRQMKDGGQFFYGETVGSCISDKLKKQDESVDAFIRQWRIGA